MATPTWMKSASSSVISSTRDSVSVDRSSPDKLAELRLLEVLDLSNSNLVGGGAVVSALDFITSAPRDCKLPLSSIDLSHNRLGDEGALELARILDENATKLSCLVSVNLFENGIRDHGAQALKDVITKHAATNLLLLESVELHDNDISEAMLSSIDDAWAKIKAARPPEWKRRIIAAGATTSSTKTPFGKLLLDQMREVQSDIQQAKRREAERLAREKERIKEECIASVLAKLTPLSEFLQHMLWEYVTTQRKILPHRMILRVFRLPTEAEEGSMPIRYGVDAMSQAMDAWKREGLAGGLWTLDALGNPTDDRDQRMQPLERMAWSKLREASTAGLPAVRAKLLSQVPRTLLTVSDGQGVFVPVETRDTVGESTVKALANEIVSLYSLLDAAVAEATSTMGDSEGLAVINQALSCELGLGVSISTKNVYLCVKETSRREELARFYISGHFNSWAEYCEGGTLRATFSTPTSNSGRQIWTASVYELTIHTTSS